MRVRAIISLIMCGLFLARITAQADIPQQMLQRINDARYQRGTPPLVLNQQLNEAARRHSIDMANNNILTHVGSDGSQFFERIRATGYTLSLGAENVLSRPDANAAAAFQQWFDSAPHQRNLLNPDYVEAGIATARTTDGTVYFTLILASRPGIVALPLPTQTPTHTPTSTAIPVTATALPPTATILPTRTLAPTDVLIATLIAPLPTNTLAPPMATRALSQIVTNTPIPTATEAPPPDLRLLYDEGSFTLLNIAGRPVNLLNLVFESASGSLFATAWDTPFLSQSLTGFTAGDCLQVWHISRAIEPTPDACDMRHAWIAVGDANRFWTDASFFTVRNGERRIGICMVEARSCDVNLSVDLDENPLTDPVIASGSLADVRLIYDADSVTVINISGRLLDLRGLVFRSENGILPIERWDSAFLSQPLSAFRDGDCLQAWTLDAVTLLPAPDECAIRHSWIAVGDEFDFWRGVNQFTVLRNGVPLQTCSFGAGRCDLAFVEAVATSVPQMLSQPTRDPSLTNGGALWLYMDANSFTLVNRGSSSVDVSSLVFAGNGATFAASRWNIPQLSQPLTALPAGDCLQIWPVGTQLQPQPIGCGIRHAWVAATVDEQFWLNGNVFTVNRGSQPLQTCEVRVPICEIRISND